MLQVILLKLFVFVRNCFWIATRTKLQNEKKKIEFLESKFMHLRNFNFNKDTIPFSNPEFLNIVSLLSENEITTGIIKEVYCSVPYNKKKPWKVYLKVKIGTWPFDRIKRIEIFKILDQLLSEEVADINYFHGK